MKTLFGLEIEMVRHDWADSGFVEANHGCCRCCGFKCKKRIYHESMGITLPDGWKLEGDCSIPDAPYGVEMVSPKLPMKEMLAQLKLACMAMSDAGYMAGPPSFCGIHVSVSMAGILGDKILKKTGEWDTGGTLPGGLYHDRLSRLGRPSYHFSPSVGRGKYYVVNQDYGKQRIEFRHLASSLNHRQIKRSVLGLLSATRQ